MYFIDKAHIGMKNINHIYQVHQIHKGIGHTYRVNLEVYPLIGVHIEQPNPLLPEYTGVRRLTPPTLHLQGASMPPTYAYEELLTPCMALVLVAHYSILGRNSTFEPTLDEKSRIES